MTDKIQLPKRVKVTAEGSWPRVEIDGQEFPWPIADDGVRVHVSHGRLPTITLTIPAESVETVHTLAAVPETNEQRKARLVADMEARKRPA